MSISNFPKKTIHLIFILLSILFLDSCGSDDAIIPPMPPEITEISNAEGELVEQGVIGETYNIHGLNFNNVTSITFNGYEINLNEVVINNELIQVVIPENTPYLDQDNTIVVTTNDGSFSIDFSLLTIENITTETIDGYNVVYINGGDFASLEEVIIDPSSTEENDEINAVIFEFDSSKITISRPEGISQAMIIVKTSLGAIVSYGPYSFD